MPPPDKSEWSIETLRIYLEAEIASAKDLGKARYDAQKVAVTKAELASDRRFESVNEFRATLSDQQRTLLPRAEFDAQHKNTNDRMDVLSRMVGEAVNRAEAQASIARITQRLDEHQQRLDRSEGKGVGLNASWVYLIGAIAALGTVVSLVVAYRVGS